jgi:hypothetical protein
MATSTASKSRPKGGGSLSLRLPMRGRGAAKAGGAQPVSVKRSKPNPILLGGLALVAVAAMARVAVPGLFGGGTSAVSSFPAPITNRHFGTSAVTSTTVAGGGAASGTASRPSRNPFSPPPGYSGS